MALLKNIPTIITNPDGEEFNVFQSGDEFSNYIHDEFDNKIIQGADSYYYLAQQEGDNIFPSDIKYSKQITQKIFDVQETEEQYKRRSLKMYDVPEIKYDKGVEGWGKKLLMGIGFSPTTSIHLGTLNNIVIFLRFSDDNNTWNNSLSHYENIFNGGRPSVRTYFDEVSYNKVDVVSHMYPKSTNDLILSYQDIYPRSYFQPYSASNTNGYQSSERTQREHDLLKRAIEAIRHEIPTTLAIDENSDGRVDNVCFIVKGNAGGWGSIIWGHRWALYSHTVLINGKRVWDFTFQPENQATVTVLSHELFHVFGAPDLYRYTSSSIDPVGNWDLMNSGDGHMGAYMKYKYAGAKWIENIPTITQSGTYRLNPLTSSTNNVYKIDSPNSTSEFFVVEYRKKLPGTYEYNVPNSGLVIYRINSLVNEGNRNGPPDEVYIYRPSGTLYSNGYLNSANYSDKVGRTSITDNTTPRAFLSDNTYGGLNITNIKELENTIEFDVLILGSDPIVNKQIELSTNPENVGSVTGAGLFPLGTLITVKSNN